MLLSLYYTHRYLNFLWWYIVKAAISRNKIDIGPPDNLSFYYKAMLIKIGLLLVNRLVKDYRAQNRLILIWN